MPRTIDVESHQRADLVELAPNSEPVWHRSGRVVIDAREAACAA